MKNLSRNLILATAACMAASGMALAEELKFDIPFAFQAGGKTMAAGTYNVTALNGETQFSFVKAGVNGGIFVNAQGSHDPLKEWKGMEGAVLQFACGDSGCSLQDVWTNKGYPAHKLATPKPHERQSMRLAIVRAAVHR